jgi:5-methylcytosine-specific restriction endonuclease McrA
MTQTEQQRCERKRELYRVWCIANRDKRRLSNRKFAALHREKRRLDNKQWRLRNLEYIRQKSRDYAALNSEKKAEYMRGYYRRRYAVPEIRAKLINQTTEYAKSHPEIRRKIHKNFKKRHPERVRAHNRHSRWIRKARIKAATVNPTSIQEFIQKVRETPYFRCYYCKHRFSSKRAHIDHIIPLSKGGAHSIENLCTACPKCNLTKSAKLIQDFVTLGQQLLAL